MPNVRLLFDTNILIGLEDSKEIETSFADLLRKAGQYGLGVLVHEASRDDINRDKNEERRKATLSKLRKFNVLEGVAVPPEAELAARFGPSHKSNDLIDAILLDAIDREIADILVTQDERLHRRAARSDLESRVLHVADALNWVEQMYEPEQISLPAVKAIKAFGLNKKHPIFDSLRADYPGFDEWLDKCIANHRDCWVIREGSALAGLVIRKDEVHSEAGTKHTGPKIMKVSTFKVADGFSGNKYGELLLKQCLWHAQRNNYDLVYLTAFKKQAELIKLMEQYGFRQESKSSLGEIVLEKPIGHGPIFVKKGQTVLEVARQNYPRFSDATSVRKFIVPIQPAYHRKLFPEVDPSSSGGASKPGNTIRKVYLCRAPTTQLRPGDILFFYKSKGSGANSQTLTSIAIVERVRESRKFKKIASWTSKRSVFSARELKALVSRKTTPLKVIDFLLVDHIKPPIALKTLTSNSILNGVPQSITKLTDAAYGRLKPFVKLGFKF
jgi:hypothetical protein